MCAGCSSGNIPVISLTSRSPGPQQMRSLWSISSQLKRTPPPSPPLSDKKKKSSECSVDDRFGQQAMGSLCWGKGRKEKAALRDLFGLFNWTRVNKRDPSRLSESCLVPPPESSGSNICLVYKRAGCETEAFRVKRFRSAVIGRNIKTAQRESGPSNFKDLSHKKKK